MRITALSMSTGLGDGRPGDSKWASQTVAVWGFPCNTGRKSNRRKCVVGSNVSHEFKIYEYVIQITDKDLISLDKTSLIIPYK